MAKKKPPIKQKWKDSSLNQSTDDMFARARIFDKDGHEVFIPSNLRGEGDDPDLSLEDFQTAVENDQVEIVDVGVAKGPKKKAPKKRTK